MKKNNVSFFIKVNDEESKKILKNDIPSLEKFMDAKSVTVSMKDPKVDVSSIDTSLGTVYLLPN